MKVRKNKYIQIYVYKERKYNFSAMVSDGSVRGSFYMESCTVIKCDPKVKMKTYYEKKKLSCNEKQGPIVLCLPDRPKVFFFK